ncbi:MAG: glycosyltransferase family 1 protein [Gemmatimonadales bacterium]|nr:MAG: glycosyltransferase family 1 protein [Gemmatimonadales bacterium]
MDVLVLNWQDRTNPQAGGAETHLHETFGRLVGRGHRVTLLCSGFPGAPPVEELDGIQVVRVGGRHSHLLAAPPAGRRLVGERDFDVVVEDLNKVPLMTPLWLPSRLPLVLLVHHLFGGTAFREAGLPVATLTWLLERPIPRVYQGVPTVAVSESTRTDLAERGIDPERVEVIPNGIDPEVLVPGPPEDRTPGPSLLYLGRLRRYKRVDLILEAVARLRERGVGVHLTVAGKGPHEGALLRRARELGLGEDSVTFAGFVSEEEKARLLGTSWVHVLTSPREGWGISNLEAAACATPTVASDSPGLRDSVRHGETGWLVPHGDVEALADRLEALLADGPLRRRMGKAARRLAEAHTWSRTAREMEAVLARVADR